MLDVVINLLASAIAAGAAWTGQYLVRYRRIARKRSFFGVRSGAEVLLFVAKHFSSPRPESVHRNDVATLVELATIIRESGGLPSLVTADEGRKEAGRVTEYCVGGPGANPRTAAHLRSSLPGVRFDPDDAAGGWLAFSVGGRTYRRRAGAEQFALLARVRRSASASPVFILAGHTALDNLAAARYLAANYKRLAKYYGQERNFCLVLGVREPAAFGADYVEIVADASTQAFVDATAPDANLPNKLDDGAPVRPEPVQAEDTVRD
jgi:hypothetical protein